MMAGPSAANLPRPGDMVAGKYVIDRLLGQGGMGAVFAARHVKLAKPVAIKVMLADAANPEAAHRFINEGRAAANIQNEHVVRVDDVDEELGYAYMVLELLDGEDLSQLLTRQGRLTAPVAADYAIQALRGVLQAHAIGIVHRDLKPSNLFLAKRKDGLVVVKVLDFGISKTQASSALLGSPSALTSTRAMLGSPLYMSPEQLRSSKSVDQRADIWAMGIILYELVTGTLPYTGETLGELFAAILELDPPPPSVHVQDLPPAFEAVILRCIERRPENRFQTAAELMQALTPFVGAPGREPAPSFPGQPTSSRVSLETPRSVPTPGATTTGAVARGATIAMSPGSTPVGMVQPQVGWQTTGGSSTGLPRTRSTMAFVGVGVGLVAIGLAGIGASVARSKAHDRAAPLRTETAFALPPPASAPAVPPLPASAMIVTPVGSAAIPPPPVSASAGVKAPPMPVVVHRPAPPGGLVPPVPVSVASPPPKKPGDDPLQNSR